MNLSSIFPIWVIDLLGSAAMILLSFRYLRTAYTLYRRDQDNALSNHLLWFCWTIFAFSVSRSMGHIIRHFLYFSGLGHWWETLSPISGSINTITFVVIASVTLFFQRMVNIMNRMNNDREKIEKTSQALILLNRDTGAIVSERTRAEMALRIAHEIRNPVTVIGGLLRRITEKEPAHSPQREHFEKIIDQARKLEELVRRFEDMRPDQEKMFTPLDFNVLMKEAVEVVKQEAAGKNIPILYDPHPAVLVFQGNRHLMKMALIHVLQNAIEVCDSGDTITVTTGMGDKGIIGTVSDTGPGLPGEIREHLFDPFYKTAKGKTGLGLAYVHQIIAEHKGKISVESMMGKGTTLEITLPTHIGQLDGEDFQPSRR